MHIFVVQFKLNGMENERITLLIDIEINDNEAYGCERDDERFAQAIEHGLRNIVVVEELAEICCQSVSTFKRHFRARYSMPPHRWFTLRKLEIAYKIILERDIAIVELTKLCGFNNASHFIAAFRKRYGVSPARLGKQLRKEKQQTSTTEKKE